MRINQITHRVLIALIGTLVLTSFPMPAMACTRVLFVAKDGTVITGRSMDWGEDLKSNMWVLPRGMQRDGMGGTNSISWESKYGSLIVSGYDIGTSEGMNEKGLVVNMLALVESDYGKPPEGTKVISMSTWAQYILDNHATVAEAVADFRKGSFQVQTVVLPTGKPANMHLAIADPTGDSAIFEYVQGKLVIHHGKQFKVMTNSPTYDKQLAIMEYWQLAGGLTKSLPGTSSAADRFVRATYLLAAIPTEAKPQYISGVAGQKFHFQAMMSVLSVMRSVGTPLGIDVDNQPWVSSTVWRTVSDSTNRIVMFDSAMTPATFWVRLDDLDLKPGAPVKKLELVGGKTYNGNAADKFVEATLFTFAPLGSHYEATKE
ncbi:Penicillin acylase precursor [Lacipirellula limnantheis]|uniref:Penicillin acylase n=2 Tax=Lacipirellula limnantheis TaxID=2528024 RepID=A0A517TYY3_9BACT|nr:Penicillin acylase precursor [Lacipirellula limnantheis]